MILFLFLSVTIVKFVILKNNFLKVHFMTLFDVIYKSKV